MLARSFAQVERPLRSLKAMQIALKLKKLKTTQLLHKWRWQIYSPKQVQEFAKSFGGPKAARLNLLALAETT